MSSTQRLPRPHSYLLGTIVAALLVFCFSAAQSPSEKRGPAIDPEILKLLPAEVIYHRVRLEDKCNALGLLREAMAKLVSIDDEDLDDKLDLIVNDKIPIPTGSDGNRLKDHLRENAPALALLDKAIARGRLQLPELRSEAVLSSLSSEVVSWTKLEHWKEFKARMLMGERKLSEAAKELLSLLQFGQMICQGDGALIHYMVGAAFQNRATECIRSMLAGHSVPPSVLEFVAKQLQEVSQAEDGIAQTYRVEFCAYCLPFLSKLPADGNVEKALEAFIAHYRIEKYTRQISDRLETRKKRILALLAGHPSAFNREQTIRLDADLYAVSIRRTREPWKSEELDRAEEIGKELAAWPEALSVGALLSLWEDREVSEEELAKARQRLMTVQNPLGKQLATSSSSTKMVHAVFFKRANLIATQVVVAIHIHFQSKGELPGSLGSLVDARLLSVIPIDPYDGKPLRYSRKKAILWSVGFDGKDNGGLRQNPKKAYTDPGYDLVWDIRIPK